MLLANQTSHEEMLPQAPVDAVVKESPLHPENTETAVVVEQPSHVEVSCPTRHDEETLDRPKTHPMDGLDKVFASASSFDLFSN